MRLIILSLFLGSLMLATGCSQSDENDDVPKDPPATDDGNDDPIGEDEPKTSPTKSPNQSSHSSENYKAQLFVRIDAFSANPTNLPESSGYKLKKFHMDKGD